MRIFPPQIVIGEEEGFAADKDIFQRASFGSGLTNLVSTSDDPLVIMLDAPWGSGKTTFIKMWAGHLRKNKLPVIYFDAFANDHVDNAFLAVAAEILRTSSALNKSKTPAHKAFLKKAARAGGIFLRTGAKIGVKAATLGAIDAADFDALKSVANDVAGEASTKADQYIEAILKLQSQEQQTIDALRKSLSNLASLFSEAQKNGTAKENPKPLVIIVDELDRCRPSFALDVLEKIKHIFSIHNVHFVLVTHMEQLEGSIRFNYGAEINAATYLQKFYNVIVHLPAGGRFKSDRIIPKYIDYLRRTFELSSDDLDLVQHVAEAKGLSLRTIDRIVTCVVLGKAFTPQNFMWLDPIVVGLCVLKISNTPLFRRAKEGGMKFADVEKEFGFGTWDEDTRKDWVRDWWIYCLAEKEEDFPNFNWQRHKESLFRYSVRDKKDLVRLMAAHLDRLEIPKK